MIIQCNLFKFRKISWLTPTLQRYHSWETALPLECKRAILVLKKVMQSFFVEAHSPYESLFFRWNSCKQNKQGANNCTTNQNQTPSPEGEKLHSDSGISVDSQSLQEQQAQTQAQTGNTCP